MGKSQSAEIHKFKVKDKKFAIDVPTSLCFEVDDLAYQILDYFPDSGTEKIVSKLSPKYRKKEVLEALGELKELQEKGLLQEDKTAVEEEKLPEEIGNITLHISHACNLRCKYCFASQGSYGGEKEQMDESVARKSVDFLMKASGERKDCGVVFFGGEPLLNFPLLKFIVDYSKEQAQKLDKEMSYTMTTNGTLLTDEIIDYLNKNKVGTMISIDGYKEAQDNLRCFPSGKGSYEVVIEGVKKLSGSRGGRLTARVTLCHNNPDAKKIADHLSQVGFDQVFCSPVSGAEGTGYELTNKDVDKLLRQYEKMAGEVTEKALKKERAVLDNFTDFVGLIHGAGKLTHACGVGFGAIAVSPSGDIYPCHRFVGMEKFKMGHVDTGLDEEARQRIQNINVLSRKPCSSCWARYLCGGGCLHEAAQPDGTFGSPNPKLCKLVRRTLELSLMIYAELLEKAPELFEPPKEKECAKGQESEEKELAHKSRT